VLELARGLGADLMFGYRIEQSYEQSMFPGGLLDIGLPPSLRRGELAQLLLPVLFARRRRLAATYLTRIFSGTCAVFAAPALSEPGRNILYCHTPPRFIYDQAEFVARHSSLIQKLGLITAGPVYRAGYERAVARMHVIVANSENVRRRIQHHLGRESAVVYPPCDTEGFRWRSEGSYYLSTGRLTALKRIDTIVRAFLKMPGKKLVVASGGTELDALRRLAADADNIRFTGWTSEADLRRLVGEAIATIYVPVDEDFGMSPVESMAAGKPCISVAEGGPLETILPGETGVLLKPFGVNALIEAVQWLGPQRAAAMRAACEARAQLFDRARFVREMRDIVDAGAGR